MVLTALPPPTSSDGWRVAIGMSADHIDLTGPRYPNEAIARSNAKRMGDGFPLFIVCPDGTRYRYFKQPGE